MTIEAVWNAGTAEQRTGLLKSIYGESWIGWHRDIRNDFNDLPYSLQNRLCRLWEVHSRRHQ